jgi:uncharacterized protein (TIGR02599 family)
MEMVELSESLSLYQYTNGSPTYAGTDWFTVPLGLSSRPVQVRAENILALIILPKLSAEEDSTGIKLASSYTYDSTQTNSDATINPKNQLPPVVQITMVAVDEASFSRYQKNSTMTNLTAELFTDASKYSDDLDTLETRLKNQRLNYRVFTSNVSLKNAKWSLEQTN